MGRFISPDSIISGWLGSLGYNLYIYCKNNGISYYDKNGYIPVPNELKEGVNQLYNLVSIVAKKVLPSANNGVKFLQILHYGRNLGNTKLPQTTEQAISQGYTQMSEGASKFHQNNRIAVKGIIKQNLKFISSNGHKEVVYYGNGKINDTPEDRGTFNIFPYLSDGENGISFKKITSGALHLVFDVIPYYFWGNSLDDSTTFADRLFMSF